MKKVGIARMKTNKKKKRLMKQMRILNETQSLAIIHSYLYNCSFFFSIQLFYIVPLRLPL